MKASFKTGKIIEETEEEIQENKTKINSILEFIDAHKKTELPFTIKTGGITIHVSRD